MIGTALRAHVEAWRFLLMERTEPAKRLSRPCQLHIRTNYVLYAKPLFNLRDSVGHVLILPRPERLLLERAGSARNERCGACRSRWRRTRGLKLLDARMLRAARETSAGRNETSEDDVLFQSAQTVNTAAKCRIDKNLRRLLEGRGREEGTARKRALLDAEYYLPCSRRHLTGRLHLRYRLSEFPIFNNIADRMVGVARVRNLHAREHLLHHDFKMFSGYRRALHFINLRCFGDDVFLHHRTTRVLEEVVKIGGAVGENLSLHHRIALFDERNPRIRRQIFVCRTVLLTLSRERSDGDDL